MKRADIEKLNRKLRDNCIHPIERAPYADDTYVHKNYAMLTFNSAILSNRLALFEMINTAKKDFAEHLDKLSTLLDPNNNE